MVFPERLQQKIKPERFIRFVLIVFLLTQTSFGFRPKSHSITPKEKAIALLEQLSPEERIGQLFLVTFEGTDVNSNTPINKLISQHHIGGVVLLAKNNNIIGNDLEPVETIEGVHRLIDDLQLIEWKSSQVSIMDPISGSVNKPKYVPVSIAISQEGDGYPNDQILYGLTTGANEMALGGSWNPELAYQTGVVSGQELTALGINLILGPALDVLESTQIENSQNLGTRTFGGDPYWVTQFGKAYISGLHHGGENRLAVMAKHFPGHGNSDRLPEEEVATVRKSLDQLNNFDLAPFFAVTGNATTPEETADGLMSSHIRYQGLQGNIRATTRPVSFDPQALTLLLQLPSLSNWRNNGGLVISDDLGNQAVRRFYSLTNQVFDARRVALNAFLAGNDLLYIGDFSSASDTNSIDGAVKTLEFFTQKYREDAAFAQRVNESALRILTLKYRIYPDFSINQIIANKNSSSEIEKSDPTTFEVARQSATLLSPSQTELDSTIPDPPNQNDRIVFISDTRTGQQCSTCPQDELIGQKTFQEAVLQLYGPQSGGQVTPINLSSFTLEDLQAVLDKKPEGNLLQATLNHANWIVFSMLDARLDIPSFQTLKRFLAERPDLYLQKRLYVFAFCAPYYLDATNISKLTAYYAMYSKTLPFIDIAANLLFGELRAGGASPVSVPGIGYKLNEALFPDPTITIPLKIEIATPTTIITATTTPEPVSIPVYNVGEIVPLMAGPILDFNGNPVPDGTPVSFIFSFGGEANTSRQETFAKDGVAYMTYTVSGPGSLEIHAESETALSEIIRLDIPAPGSEIVTITPTTAPTTTSTQKPPTPTSTPIPKSSVSVQTEETNLGDWILAVLVTSMIAFIIYRIAALNSQVRWGIRSSLAALIGGLFGYIYLTLNLLGTGFLRSLTFPLRIVIMTSIGSVLGLLLVIIWREIELHKQSQIPADENRISIS